MLDKFKKSWRDFEQGQPGKRFRQRFEKRLHSGQSAWHKVLFISLGILVMTVGVIFLVTPGPGLLVIFAGAALIAQQSLLAARILDWIELRLRKLAVWSLTMWHRVPLAVKTVLLLLAMASTAALAYSAHMLLFAR